MFEADGGDFHTALLKVLGASDLPKTTSQVTSELNRKLGVAHTLFNAWTEKGSLEAALAERFVDGSVSALEKYLLPAEDVAGNLANATLCNQVERRQADQLTYEEFAVRFLLPNRPVLIQGISRGWPAAHDWACPDGSVNLEFLVRNFGSATIWATETERHASGYGSGKRHEMAFQEYAEYWSRHKQGLDDRILYLKDWHFVNEFPGYQAYSCPEWFRDDWLNDYYEICQTSANGTAASQRSQQDIVTSDYRFVYLGPKGSWTLIHADVLRSYSWSTNVTGRKRWRLLPPELTPLLFDRFGREMAPRFDADGEGDGFPNLALAARHVVELEQGVDEALFVPSGWHHSVENLEDTLSINHNWLNGFNIHWGWEHLQEERAEAAASIEDCRSLTSPTEFEGLVQRNMAANCGMNFGSFAHFLATVAVRQLRLLDAESPSLQGNQLVEVFALHRCAAGMRALLLAMDPVGVHGSSDVDEGTVEVDALEVAVQSLLGCDASTQVQMTRILSALLDRSDKVLQRVRDAFGEDSNATDIQ